MASAYAALGKARRKQSKISREREIGMEAISAVGGLATFGVGQIKKAATAWKEYEAGYKELGGNVKNIKKPGFFKRTAQQFLPGGKTGLPEGKVRIGNMMYDRSKIQKAGSFLGSNAAAILDQTAIDRYLGRTAPGKKKIYSEPLQETEAGGYGVDPSPRGPNLAGETLLEKVGKGVKKVTDYGKAVVGTAAYKLGGHISEGLKDTGGEFSFKDFKTVGDYGKAVAGTAAYRIGQGLEEGAKYNTGVPFGEEWDVVPKEKDTSAEPTGGTAFPNFKFLPPFKPKFARGGDFITNGPQEIIVGDNPGGRERVTIVPLDSEDIKGYYGKKHNWLEALYENNTRRKKY